MNTGQDDGFTLVELILVVAISALVIPALASVLLVYFRTAFVASVRTDRAHDGNLLSSYMQPDLASVRTAPTLSGSGCSSTAVFSWTQQNYVPNGVGTTSSYVATYSASASSGGDAPFALRRSLTVDGVASGTVLIAHNLSAACSASFAISGSLFTASVTQSDSSGNAEASVLKFSGNVGGRL